METSKLLEWLRKLTSAEFDDFIDFAESPYHNSKKAIIPLIKYLKKYHPELRGTKVAKKLVFKKIHPVGREYNVKRLDVLMSQTMRLLERFFAYETVKHDALTFQRQQLFAFRNRGLDKSFARSVKTIEDILDTKRQDHDYHLAKYQLNREIFYHPATPRRKPGMPSLEGALYHLDAFFVWEKLQLSAMAFNRMRVLNESYEFSLLKSVREDCAEMIESSDSLRFLNKIVRLLEKAEVKLFEESCVEFLGLHSKFPFEESHVYLQFLLSVGVRLQYEGHSEMHRYLFELQKLGLDEEYFHHNGNIAESQFLSICTTACMLELFEWATDFVKSYKARIFPKKNQENTVNLGLATIVFRKSIKEKDFVQFQKANDYLLEIEFTSKEYTYRIKSMQLRLYYDFYSDNKEGLDFILNFALAFERQLLREKIMKSKRIKRYMYFVKLVKKLVKYQKNKSEHLKNEIIEQFRVKGILGGAWLTDKIREMN